MDDISLVMQRHGYPEETHFAFSQPVRDEAGRAFCPQETTRQVLAERRTVAERERLRQLFDQAPGFGDAAWPSTFELVNAAYLQPTGHRDQLPGSRLREAPAGDCRTGLLRSSWTTSTPPAKRSVATP